MSSTTAPRAARPGLSLAAVLAVCALSEILFYRVLRPMLRTEADILPEAVLSVVAFLAGLTLNLTSVLGLFLVSGMLLALLRPGLIKNPLGHVSFALVGGVHVLLLLPLLFFPAIFTTLGIGAGRAQVLLQVSFACLALLLAAAVLPLPAPGRLKAGVGLLLAPALCYFYTYWTVAKGNGYSGNLDALAFGQGILGLAAALSPLCFLPGAPRRGLPFSLLAAGLVVLAATTLCFLDSETCARIAYAALSVRLPPSRLIQGLYLFALGSYLFTTVLLLCQVTGPYRLRGFGLLLVGLGGYQIQEGHRMALFLLGLFALLQSAADARPLRRR